MRTYPVVHHVTAALTLEQARLALGEGADGIFLISHGGSDGELGPLVRDLAAEFGADRVGVNYLGSAFLPGYVRARSNGAGLYWDDAPGISGEGAGDEARAVARDLASRPGCEVFASVAFKYQAPEPDPPRAAANAAPRGFVPTTTGAATGRAPEAARVSGMAAALRGGPLAVASGLAVGNLPAYAGSVTHCLVASSVCRDGDFHRFDPERLRSFISAARSLAPA